MTTFAERKAARKSAGAVKYRFEVREDRLDGTLVGTFDSRKQAEAFAFEQIGPDVGNTLAYKAWHATKPHNEFVPFCTNFKVIRIKVEQ